MVRQTLSNRATLLNREESWLKFNWRVIEEPGDLRNPLLERVKFLAISASNLDEFFEIRVGGLLQQLEDGHNSTTPDGLTMVEERELIKDATHELVAEQYSCWNERLRRELAEQEIRVLGIDELDDAALAFVDDYCERELDPLLTPVTVEPAHPFPRVINKALCVALLLRRRRRSSLTYTGVVTVPRALRDWSGCHPRGPSISFSLPTWSSIMRRGCIRATTSFLPPPSASPATATFICRKKSRAICWNRCGRNCTTAARATQCGWRSSPRPTPRSSSGWARCSNFSPGRFFRSTAR